MYMQNDTQAAFSRFHSTFLKLYDKHFAKRKITEKYNSRKPWLSEGLKQSIRNKNKLYIHMLKMRTATNEMKYKRYRNKLTHVLKWAERKYYADILEKNRSNLKQTWVILKSIINKNKSSRIQQKFKSNEGSTTTEKSVINEKFNDFFISIGPSLARKIPEQNISRSQFMGDRVTNTIFLEPVTIEEVKNIVMSLKKWSCGL